MLKYQLYQGSVIAWGVQLEGENVYEGAPLDYSPQKYDYVEGEFVIKEDWVEPIPPPMPE
jgi:hypothetical protein